jgi:signal transduction histidine kinase
MARQWKAFRWWILAWVALTLAGAVAIARLELAQLKDAFETNARIMHRLLSQRVVQHDAILATLALLQPGPDGPADAAPEQRLPALYPQILSAQRRDREAAWSDPAMASAEATSRQLRRATLADLDFASGRYQLVLAAQPASYALTIDLRAMVPWAEWPLDPASSPVRVVLEHSGQQFVLQPGRLAPGGWRFEFHKHLAADSQAFDVVATQTVGWAELPWGRMALWALVLAAVLAWARHGLRQRAERSRAEELLRLGQVARLNTLGELAAGMAHELNQPLTAVMASTQAARRLLDDDPPELDTARQAMAQAVEQARRASDVVGRLRRAIERPDLSGQTQALDLVEAVRRALYLLEPECQRRGVAPVIECWPNRWRWSRSSTTCCSTRCRRWSVPCAARRLTLQGRERVGRAADRGRQRPRHRASGPAAHLRALLHHPHRRPGPGPEPVRNAGRPNMGGALTAAPNEPHGALFTLTLPCQPQTP